MELVPASVMETSSNVGGFTPEGELAFSCEM